MGIIYPISRLLANPRVFYAIASYLESPYDPEALKEAFYDLLEYGFEEGPPEECQFYAEEAYFEVSEDGTVCFVALDNGNSARLEALSGEFRTEIRNEKQFTAAAAVNRRLITAIEESHPEFKDDISLEHPPTPGNGFLSSEKGNQFEGSFHLRSDPEKRYSFTILVVDSEADKLEAQIQPM